MKKKLILMLSIMAIAVCMFALTVSASNYIDLSQIDFNFAPATQFDFFYNNYGVDSDFESSEDDTFGVFYFESSNGCYAYGFINIEWWHSYLSSNNVQSANDFNQLVFKMVDDGLIYDTNDASGIVYQLASNSNYYYEVYQSYVAELNAKTYEEGLIEGKAEGIEYFKTSTEYETTLNNKYVLGQKEGVANYLKSDDYTNALDAEYDAGYNQGVSDTESTSSSSGTGALFSVLAIVLVVLAGFYIYKSVSRKRRR